MSSPYILWIEGHPIFNNLSRIKTPALRAILPRVRLVANDIQALDLLDISSEMKGRLESIAIALHSALEMWAPDISDDYEKAIAEQMQMICADAEIRIKEARAMRTEVRLQRTSQELQSVKEESTQIAVAEEESFFTDLARRNDLESFCWGAIAVAIAVGGISYVVLDCVFRTTETPKDGIALVHEFGPRVLVVSLFYFLMAWASGNSRTAAHNRMLNEQRAGALKSYPGFKIGSSGESDLRQQVVMRVVSMLCDTQSNGSVVEPTKELKEAAKTAAPVPEAIALSIHQILERIARLETRAKQ